jgi:uncharacterized membrane protein HdeD (DUF308 family)
MDAISVGSGILMLLLGIAIYFAPTLVANSRGKRNTTAIFCLNLFTGWTFIGWIIALVWAFTHESKND